MNAVQALPPIDLASVDAAAALQTRTDRKYLLDEEQLGQLIVRLAGQANVLEIDGRRTFRYRSVYFDTPEYDSYLGAARRRPDRFKVRTRTYVDTDTTWLEVKRRDRRGRTVKHRVAAASATDLGADDRSFIASFDTLADVAGRLVPTLTTSYERTTLVVGPTRVTIDRDVHGTAADGREVAIGGVIVETKSDRPGGSVDRVLWALGVRPVTISKYATELAALHPELPSNKWHRVLHRHVTAVSRSAAGPARARTRS